MNIRDYMIIHEQEGGREKANFQVSHDTNMLQQEVTGSSEMNASCQIQETLKEKLHLLTYLLW